MASERDERSWDAVAELGDPVAGRVAWTPLVAASATMRMMRLRDLGADGLLYRPTAGGLMFLGVMALFTTASGFVTTTAAADDAGAVAALFGLPLLAVGCFLPYLMMRSFMRSPFFNARARRFEMSRGPRQGARAVADEVPFEEMHALQIVRYFEAGDAESPGYDVVQLNVVTHEGKRVHVTSSPESGTLEAEARVIARLLNVPVWHRPHEAGAELPVIGAGSWQ